MALTEYRRKRNFRRTKEPAGRRARSTKRALKFVIQKHAASRLHYDFRLEWDGVLKSWAVPKGPSLDPSVRALAVEVEDHPIEYGRFEGTIPQGEYGGGTVLLWDRGQWVPLNDPARGFRDGKIDFELRGEKLQGRWKLVRLREDKGDRHANWLLIKSRDEFARTGLKSNILTARPESVATGRDLAEISSADGRVWRSGRARSTRRPAATSTRNRKKKARRTAP